MAALVSSSKPLLFDYKKLKPKPDIYWWCFRELKFFLQLKCILALLEVSQHGIMSSVFGHLSVEMRQIHDQTTDMQAICILRVILIWTQ